MRNNKELYLGGKHLFHSYKLFWLNFFKLNGRSRRRDFWWPFLINSVIEILLSAVANIFENFNAHGELISTIIYDLVILILNIGTFTLSVRCFYDIGMTKMFPVFHLVLVLLPFLDDVTGYFINQMHLAHNSLFVNIYGGVLIAYVIVFLIASFIALAYCGADSEKGFNKYGPNPKPIYE